MKRLRTPGPFILTGKTMNDDYANGNPTKYLKAVSSKQSTVLRVR